MVLRFTQLSGAQQGKQAAASVPGCLSHGARRSAVRQAQATTARRSLVRLAAAEPEAAQAVPRQRRQQRTVTVQLEDLKPGAEIAGRVTKIEGFGAFVDIGASKDALLHISQMSDGFVKAVADVVKVGDTLTAKVLSVDAAGQRIALTLKGTAAAKRGGGGGGKAARDAAAAAGAGGEAEEEVGLQLDDNEGIVEGVFFRVEDDDEAAVDEMENVVTAAADVALLALAEHDLVSGKVVGVEDFGVIVEFAAGDATHQGLLHISQMRAPGAALAAELGEAAELAAADNDEAEFLGEEFEDVGGVDKPSTYYKIGDDIKCFVAEVEGGSRPRISLTQVPPFEAFADDDDDGEGAATDALLSELLADADDLPAFGGDDDDGDQPRGRLDRVALSASIYAGQAANYTERAAGGFLSAKSGSFVSPGAFPERALRDVASLASKVPQAGRLYGDDGDDSELVDFWVDDINRGEAKSALRSLGYSLAPGAEGGYEVVPAYGANPEALAAEGEEAEEALLFDLLNANDEAAINGIVDDILSEGEVQEAERPFLARRNPTRVFAMTVEAEAGNSPAAAISASDVKALRTQTGAGMMDCKKALKEAGGNFEKAAEWLRQKGLSGADKKSGRVATEGLIARYIHPGGRLGVLLEVNCETDFVAASEQFQRLASELAMVAASSDAVCVSADGVPPEVLAKEREVEMGREDLKSKPEAVRAKIVDGRLEKIRKGLALLEQPALRDNNKTCAEVVKETIAAVGENIQVRRFVKFNLGEGLQKRSNDFAAEVAQQTQAKKDPAPEAPKAAAPAKEEKKEEAKPAVAISASLVKELRDKSGAGMMDCKKALAQCGGDVEAASEWLRKKGLASADKKSGRAAAEGTVAAYIHPGSRLGVLLEINCETDFVAASDQFQQLVSGVAMQIAASPSVEYVTAADVPAEVLAHELEIEKGREDLASKPEAIRSKIAEGRVKKLAMERVLLEQPWLMDQNKTVGEAVKEAIATIGENIQVRRFERFVLGEGLQKKESNLAAEVAAATGKQ